MNTEQEERVQMYLRDIMHLVATNRGVIDLQRIIPRLAEYQNNIAKVIPKQENALLDIINNMTYRRI